LAFRHFPPIGTWTCAACAAMRPVAPGQAATLTAPRRRDLPNLDATTWYEQAAPLCRAIAYMMIEVIVRGIAKASEAGAVASF